MRERGRAVGRHGDGSAPGRDRGTVVRLTVPLNGGIPLGPGRDRGHAVRPVQVMIVDDHGPWCAAACAPTWEATRTTWAVAAEAGRRPGRALDQLAKMGPRTGALPDGRAALTW